MYHSIENYLIENNIFLAIMSLGLETEDQVKYESDKVVSNNSWNLLEYSHNCKYMWDL